MGQPIELVDQDGKPFVVYGRHEAAVYLSQGYTHSGTVSIPGDDLTQLDGATESIVNELHALGLYSYASVAGADADKLTAIHGIGKATAKKLQDSAAKLR